MEANFWLERWEANQTSFHRSEANKALVAHIDKLALENGARVFVPLCGKTLDIGWLLSKGYRVAGAELSPLASDQLFEELGVVPNISGAGSLKHYSAERLDIFVGNIFDLDAKTLGPIDAIYDRAALIALPLEMRQKYTAHLAQLTGRAPQLLLTIDYDQSQMEGPPFSVIDAEAKEHYAGTYDVTLLSRTEVPGGIKGIMPGDELVWLLR